MHDVELSAFRLAAYSVTNVQFAEFRRCHRLGDRRREIRVVVRVRGVAARRVPPTRGVQGAEWWRQVMGADWRHPEGPHSDVSTRPSIPPPRVLERCPGVLRLLGDPAAHGSGVGGGRPGRSGGRPFPWGDELEPGGSHRMNVFQGDFPRTNTGTTAISALHPSTRSHRTDTACSTCAAMSGNGVPTGSTRATTRHHRWGRPEDPSPVRSASCGVVPLCHASYCRRYRVSARFGNEPDSSSGNVGFRVVAG